MDAKELNDALTQLFHSALRGVMEGKIQPADAVGLVEIHRADFGDRVRLILQQAAARSMTRLIIPKPPNG